MAVSALSGLVGTTVANTGAGVGMRGDVRITRCGVRTLRRCRRAAVGAKTSTGVATAMSCERPGCV